MSVRIVRTNAPFAANGPGLSDFLERLVKLIPAEVVGLFLVGVGVIPSDQRFWLAVWTGICFLLVIWVRALATQEAGKGPQWAAVFISAVAFVIWTYQMGGAYAAYHIWVGFLGSLAVLLWTFVVPLIYKGD